MALDRPLGVCPECSADLRVIGVLTPFIGLASPLNGWPILAGAALGVAWTYILFLVLSGLAMAHNRLSPQQQDDLIGVVLIGAIAIAGVVVAAAWRWRRRVLHRAAEFADPDTQLHPKL